MAFSTLALQDNGSLSKKTNVGRKSNVSDLHASSWSRCRSWDSSPPGREIRWISSNSSSLRVVDRCWCSCLEYSINLFQPWNYEWSIEWYLHEMLNLKTHQCFIFSPRACPVVPGNLARSLQHIRSTRHPTRAAPQGLQKNLCPFDPNYMKKTSFESMSDKTNSIPFWFS